MFRFSLLLKRSTIHCARHIPAHSFWCLYDILCVSSIHPNIFQQSIYEVERSVCDSEFRPLSPSHLCDIICVSKRLKLFLLSAPRLLSLPFYSYLCLLFQFWLYDLSLQNWKERTSCQFPPLSGLSIRSPWDQPSLSLFSPFFGLDLSVHLFLLNLIIFDFN